MNAWFVVVYKDLNSDRVHDSRRYDTLKEAVDAAFDLLFQKCEPLRITGPSGEIISQAQLNDFLAARGHKGRGA